MTRLPTERNSKAILAGLLVLIHIGLSWWYGRLLPWGGDEWYTYDGRTLMAVPNTILIEMARILLGEVTPGNFMLYRLTGVVWGSLTIAGLFLLGTSEKRYSFLVPASLFLVVSPFVFYQEQYFRYYGYYLAAAFGVFLLILHLDADYRRKRWIFWGLLLISPFLYLFLGLQLACYVAFREWTCLSKRARWVVAGLGVIGLSVAFFSWRWLIQTGMEFAFSGMSSAAGNETVLRGFSPGLVIKPFYFVFELFWGYHVEPTENLWVIVGVVVLFLLLSGRFVLLAVRNVNPAVLFGVCLLVPLTLIFLVIEPVTPPGATQLESKHALFGVPWLLMIAFMGNGVPGRGAGFVIVGCIALVSLFFTFSRPAPAWPAIVDQAAAVVEEGGRVVVDGRSNRTFRFYAQERVNPEAILLLGSQGHFLEDSVEKGSRLMAIHDDWKAYQFLSLRQNWNSGSDSSTKVEAVADFERQLIERRSAGDWGMVQFPLHAFSYSHRQLHSILIPSVLPIPYRDLEFPLVVEGVSIIGAARILQGRNGTANWGSSGQIRVNFFLKGAASLAEGDVIGQVSGSGGSIVLRVGPLPDSGYQAEFSRGIQGSEEVSQWHKRPLVSQAARYPGSFLPGAGKIFGLSLESEGPIEFEVTRPEVELVILVPKPSR